MASASLLDLQNELIALVKSVPAFKNNGFSIFDIKDLEDQSAQQTFPIVGVGYDGAEASDNAKGNAANPVADKSGGVTFIIVQFTIVLAVQYHYAGQDDTKPQAMGLLDDVRRLVLGYKGVNTRPWKYVGERPEPSLSVPGLVFYTQVWQTAVPVVGSSNNS